MPELNPAVAALAPLLGTWSGRGSGAYPTIAPFDYLEDVAVGHTGKPFLAYTQRTRSPDGVPMHAEAGYLRMPTPGRVELILAHPTGITEIDEGTVSVDDGGVLTIELRSTSVGRSASAKEVVALERSIRVDGDDLHYTVRMGAVGQPLQHHLSATLSRQP
ncbi:MAG: FABP family protein [Mycobacterium sp.]|nr:FABP family protein [Mycobacterium sp.]